MVKNNLKNIVVNGARIHNLKNINIKIPHNKLVAITGVSGSGKSSLAFDTLYAEGQRRYIESFSSYARQFLGVMDKPDVGKIEGLPPAISIDRQSAALNPRSTVGTMTEIYAWLRLLFSRVGKPYCPKCNKLLSRQNISQIINRIFKLPHKAQVYILAPLGEEKIQQNLKKFQNNGFISVRINPKEKNKSKKFYKIEEVLKLNFNHSEYSNIELVVDKFIFDKKKINRIRIIDSLETALKIGDGILIIQFAKNNKVKSKDLLFNNKFICRKCNITIPEIEPRLFSFNSPLGACQDCMGLGLKSEIEPSLIIPNIELSLAEGAIRPWALIPPEKKNNSWEGLKKIAKEQNFSLNKPVKSLSKNILKLILYGEKDYKGIIPLLEYRYQATNSNYIRTEIGKYMVSKICPSCGGKRLRPEALAIKIKGKNIDEIVSMSIEDCKSFFKELLTRKEKSTASQRRIGEFIVNSRKTNLSKTEARIAKPIIKEIINQLQLLIDVNLEYLSLSRNAPSISVGETQRIKLATQIASKLTGVLYVLDEPSIGLHARDQERLIKVLKRLRDAGNTVLVVEHDAQTIKVADWVIDVGPGAGEKGGKIIFKGTPKELKKSNTLTGKYLSKRLRIDIKKEKNSSSKQTKLELAKFLTIERATEHNLKNINVKIPLNTFCCITGVSGSGKSTLISDILAKTLAKKFYKARQKAGACKRIIGLENLNKVVIVNQSPIGRTPRSNPATYTGIFNHIRNLFTNTKQAKNRGYDMSLFSFNVKGGRCEECQGTGFKKIEMYLLPDKYIKCPVCQGKKYNKEILEIKYNGINIAEALDMTVREALDFFRNTIFIKSKLKILDEVGLSYLKLNQPAPSLSGGEAQRIKLATELSRKSFGKTIYILDEPTTGLHPADIKNLLNILKKLVNKGNSVLVIEHDLDMIRNSDWVIDLGPEGGDKGGYIVAEGTPNEITKVKESYTGQWLKKVK